MKHIVLIGIASGCFGFAIAQIMLGDLMLGWIGLLCAVGFFVASIEGG